MSSIRPSSCTTFPTGSTSPHRGSSSVYRGWRGPSAPLSPISLETRPAHHTPTPQSPGQGGRGVRTVQGLGVSTGLTKKPQEALTVGASGNLSASTAVREAEADQVGLRDPPEGAPGPPVHLAPHLPHWNTALTSSRSHRNKSGFRFRACRRWSW